MDLATSARIIRQNQSPNGAYIACPSFPTYAYCWLRDGSFIAYSMLVAGERDSALAFLRWCSRTIVARRADIAGLEAKLARGERPEPAELLPARYELDGSVSRDDWPNFQSDGYGAWLWCLGEWQRAAGRKDLEPEFREAAELSLRYLRLVWRMPCYDCWEENGDKVHLSTLACIYGGLKSLDALAPGLGARDLAEEVRALALASVLPVGRYAKYIGSTAVDASLLWLALPFGLVGEDDPAFLATVARIEGTLLRDRGVKRYAEDSYYGGGQWIILSAWLGWHYARSGRIGEARAILEWIEAQADAEGRLPEQAALHLNDPAYLPVWERRWGKSASPLLWSHAMHIVLAAAIGGEGDIGSDRRRFV